MTPSSIYPSVMTLPYMLPNGRSPPPNDHSVAPFKTSNTISFAYQPSHCRQLPNPNESSQLLSLLDLLVAGDRAATALWPEPLDMERISKLPQLLAHPIAGIRKLVASWPGFLDIGRN